MHQPFGLMVPVTIVHRSGFLKNRHPEHFCPFEPRMVLVAELLLVVRSIGDCAFTGRQCARKCRQHNDMLERLAARHFVVVHYVPQLVTKGAFDFFHAAFDGGFRAPEEVHHPPDYRDQADERQDEDDEEHPGGDVGKVQDGLFHDMPLRPRPLLLPAGVPCCLNHRGSVMRGGFGKPDSYRRSMASTDGGGTLYIAGSSSAVPRPGRANSGYVLRVAGGCSIALDFGTGVFASVREHMEPEQLDAVVISHMHADHFFDLIPLRYALRYELERAQPLIVYLPPGGIAIAQTIGSPLKETADFYSGVLICASTRRSNHCASASARFNSRRRCTTFQRMRCAWKRTPACSDTPPIRRRVMPFRTWYAKPTSFCAKRRSGQAARKGRSADI